MLPAKSLYIHIPFCRSKCAYCDFFSMPSSSVPDLYVDSLINEFHFHIQQCSIKKLETVYIGGGTPSLLSVKQIKRLLDEILPHCHDFAEITLEANPDSLSNEFLSQVIEFGINRISLGVQSLDDKTLLLIGRRSDSAGCKKALQLLSDNGINFSADMISGLPEQTNEIFLEGLRELISFKPNHISLYSLTLEEGTPLEKRISNGELEYSEDYASDQWILGRDLLESYGYIQYEVSNFAPEGNESRHNMAYWRQQSYIGLGSGATGTLYLAGDKTSSIASGLRYTNISDIKSYVDFWSKINKCDIKALIHPDSPVEKEILDLETLSFEFCMLGLRTKKGISVNEYERRFSCKLNTPVFEKYIKRSLMVSLSKENETIYSMNKDGMLFLNSFLADLIE